MGCCTTIPSEHTTNTQPLPVEKYEFINGEHVDVDPQQTDHHIVATESDEADSIQDTIMLVIKKEFIQQLSDNGPSVTKKGTDQNGLRYTYYNMISTEYIRNIIIQFIQSKDTNCVISDAMIKQLLTKWKDSLYALYSQLLEEYPDKNKDESTKMDRNITIHRLSDEYEIGDKLQRATFGNINSAKYRKDNKLFAIKIIHKQRLNECDLKRIRGEIDIMRGLKHANLVRLYDIFESSQQIGLIIDVLQREYNLLDVVIKIGILSENEASKYFIMLCNALKYMHSKHIIHGNIKADNILFTDNNYNSLKLVYCGIDYVDNIQNTDYMAPDKECSIRSDMWSAGCILYLLLFGYPPFDALDHDKKVIFHDEISEDAKDLIIHLLERNVEQRFTAEQALDHKWMESASTEVFDGDRMDRLRRYRVGGKLKRGANCMIAVHRLIEIFDEFTIMEQRQNDIIQDLQKLNFEADKLEDRITNMVESESEEIVPFVLQNASDDSDDERGAMFNQPSSLHQTHTVGRITINDDDDSD